MRNINEIQPMIEPNIATNPQKKKTTQNFSLVGGDLLTISDGSHYQNSHKMFSMALMLKIET